jgi:hypothetical protein
MELIPRTTVAAAVKRSVATLTYEARLRKMCFLESAHSISPDTVLLNFRNISRLDRFISSPATNKKPFSEAIS